MVMFLAENDHLEETLCDVVSRLDYFEKLGLKVD